VGKRRAVGRLRFIGSRVGEVVLWADVLDVIVSE
jgi:hypothetical protein